MAAALLFTCCRVLSPPITFGSNMQAKAEEDIYLGKGRFIKDDPKKYPTKTELTGGWAGGEAALWALRDEINVRWHSCSSSTL